MQTIRNFISGRLVLAAFSLLIAACAQKEIVKPEIPPRPERATVNAFVLNGRAIITQAGKANTVRIVWEHSPAVDSMGFATPLGSMLAELQRTAQGARWTSADGDTYSARNADTLMARLTDVPVPLDALALWVTGQFTPNALIKKKDDAGRVLQAIDHDWGIQIVSYETDLPNALPSVVEARYAGLSIRLAVEEWQL
jgi:outer membrane lipoprotein LolB